MLSAAVLALTIGYSAFIAEVFRAGIQSVEAGQIEAAKALVCERVDALAPALLAASEDGLKKDRAVWNELDLNMPLNLTERDAAVIAFGRFCDSFRV